MTRPLRVLMVEDSEDDATLVEMALRGGGYDVRALRVDDQDALRAALDERGWDLVISDYSLPSFDARDTLRIMRETGCDTPVIVVSGTVGEDVAVETLKLGAEDYLLKQNLTRLVPAAQRALEAVEDRRQHRRTERMKTLILQNSLDIICTTDAEGRFLEVSAAVKAVLGYAPAELLGIRLHSLIHADDLPLVEEEFQAVLRGHHVWDLECRLIGKSGEAVHVTWSITLSGADGVVVAVGRDITERKQKDEILRRAEESVRRERALLRSLIDSIPDLVFFKDQNFVFLGCNRTFENYLGLTESEIIGKTDFDIAPEQWARYYRTGDETLLASGRMQRTEEQIPGKDGRIGTFDTIKTPFYGPDGSLLGLLGVSRDITDRKQMEATVREERDYADAILNSLPGVFYHYDDSLRLVRWNRNLERISGYSAEELATTHPLDFFVEAEKPLIASRIKEVFETGESQVEADYLLKDGRLIPYLFTGMRFERGGRQGFVGVGTDITERKRMEDALREKTALFEAQVEASIAGILVISGAGRKIIQNRRMSEMWAIPPDIAGDPDMASQLAYAATQVKDPDAFLARVRSLREHPDEIGHDEIELLDGRTIKRYAAPVRDKEGRYYGRTWVHTDITEERRREQRLRQAEKMEALGTFAAGIAHDFNNMLAVIQGNADLIAEEDPSQESARAILRATERASDLVEQILGFAKRQHAPRAPMDLRIPVTEAIRLLQSGAAPGVAIEQHLPAQPAMITGNATQMLRLVLNLGKNAIQAMARREPARLTVRLETATVNDRFALAHPPLQPGPALVLTVRDTGPGMDRATVARIFEPFFSTKGAGGTGLGLALVHGIVAQHEGCILVDSTPGAGTAFTTWLPMLQETAADAPQPPARQAKRLLVVDAEPGVAAVTVQLLSALGYAAEALHDPLAARDRILAAPQGFDLVIVESRMPGFSGLDLADSVKPSCPDLRFILVGGQGPVDGSETVLTKPFTLAQLKDACAAAFNRP